MGTRFPVPAVGANQSSATDFEELTLDPVGNVTQRRLRDGRTIGYAWDALNRMTAKNVPEEVWWEADVAYAYDLLGRLVSATDGLGYAALFGYDALGRIVSEGSNWYGSFASQYDLAGRRTRLAWPDGFFVDYDHLVTGEVTAIRENGATSGPGVLAAFGYDDLGRRTSLTRGNGAVTSYAYDPASRLQSLVHDLAGTAHDLTLAFGYTPAMQIASTVRSNDAYSFAGLVDGSVAATHNGLNQILTTGGTAVAHDARIVEALQFIRGIFASREYRPTHRAQQHRAAKIKGVFDRVRDLAGRRGVRNPELGKNPWQQARDDRADVRPSRIPAVRGRRRGFLAAGGHPVRRAGRGVEGGTAGRAAASSSPAPTSPPRATSTAS